MSSVAKENVEVLCSASARFSKANGANFCLEVERASELLLQWILHLEASQGDRAAIATLNGVRGAVREVAGLLSLGLVRPALGALRAQLDLVLSWLYFKDHPIEWQRLLDSGDGFRQKSELIKYLSEVYEPSFRTRYALLESQRTRHVSDPYSLVSAHLHRQGALGTNAIEGLHQLVGSISEARELVLLQAACSEYLSDVLVSCYAASWATLPRAVVDSVRRRLTPAQEKVIFAT